MSVLQEAANRVLNRLFWIINHTKALSKYVQCVNNTLQKSQLNPRKNETNRKDLEAALLRTLQLIVIFNI